MPPPARSRSQRGTMVQRGDARGESTERSCCMCIRMRGDKCSSTTVCEHIPARKRRGSVCSPGHAAHSAAPDSRHRPTCDARRREAPRAEEAPIPRIGAGLSGGTDQQPNNKIQLRRYELMIRLDIVHDTILDNKFNGNYMTVIEYDLKNIIILLLYS
jgi:hypothetical protein